MALYKSSLYKSIFALIDLPFLQTNHSFEPNCRWGTIDHPTFGRIPSIVTLQIIPAGTEITVHYQIDMSEASIISHTQWYVKLWEEFSLRRSPSRPEK